MAAKGIVALQARLYPFADGVDFVDIPKAARLLLVELAGLDCFEQKFGYDQPLFFIDQQPSQH